MKLLKIFLLLSFLGANVAQANITKPIPSAVRSLRFNNNQWTLSLTVFHYSYETGIDSIKLITSTDTAFVKKSITDKMKLTYDTYYTITNDSLNSPLTIKQAGDELQIVITFKQDTISDYQIFTFGNYPNSTMRALNDNEYYYSPYINKFTICNNKTCYATLQGHIYDKNGLLLKNTTFNNLSSSDIWSDTFTTDNDGAYCISIYTGVNFSESYLYQTIKDYHSYSIEPISYNANPGDTIVRDIHLKKAYVSEGEKESVLSQFFCSPNPAREQIVFTYSIDNLIPMNDVALLVYDASGKLMDKLSIDTNEGSLIHNLDARYKAGSYSYVVRGKNSLIYRGQFFVQ